MLRRTLRKIIPIHAIFPLCLTGLMNLLAYQGAKLVQFFTGYENALDMTTAFDRAIPLQPAWVLIYVATFVFWIYQYTTVARESPAMACRLAAADGLAKLICLLFFLLLPTTNVRQEVPGSGVFSFLLRFIYWVDTPTNLFPSIHCFVAWLGTRFLFDCKKGAVPVLCSLGSLLVFASTLFTHQHVIADVLAGVAVAELGYLVAKHTALPRLIERLNDKFTKTRLSRIL